MSTATLPALRRVLRRGLSLALPAWLAGCTADPVAPGGAQPVIDHASASAGTANVLSAIVAIFSRRADSVAVAWHASDGTEEGTSASVVPLADSALVPVLGLRASTTYVLRPVAFSGGRIVNGDSLLVTTGELPSDLPGFTAAGPDPDPGYVVFAEGRYGLVIDNTGRVVWYRRFAISAGLDFQVLPDGHYAARPPTPALGDVEPIVEIDPLGNITRTIGCTGGLQVRFHDLVLAADGSAWVMCDEIRTMDLSAVGGVAAATVTGTDIQHVAPDGTLLFAWSPFDHFAITDLDSAMRTGTAVNFTHGNALAFDTDGNLLVSFRSLSEITKIDVHTGAVLWRMGGRRNEFDFAGAPGPPFAGQHGLRVDGGGTLLLLDNAGDPSATRAEHYTLDESARTARRDLALGATPPVIGLLGGSVQRLPRGHLLVSYGNGDRLEEYDASGNVAWRLQAGGGYVFRAQRIQSLYHPETGTAR